MRKTLMLCVGMCVGISAACASPVPKDTGNAAGAIATPSKQETLRRNRDLAMAPIKSESDLTRYLGRMPKDSPLRLLSNGARQRFIKSLRFGSQGLGSFSYKGLETELTASQIYRVLSLFGVQRSTSLIKGARVVTQADKAVMDVPDSETASESAPMMDHLDYWCASRATCSRSAGDICTGNC